MEFSAGFIIYRKVGPMIEFLLLYPGEPHSWCPPKGHLEHGEDEWAAAIRETKEEAGISEKQLLIYENCFDEIEYSVISKETGQWVPKKVKYWLAELIEGEIRLSDEHEDWGWFNLDQTIEKTSRYPGMEALLRRFYACIKK